MDVDKAESEHGRSDHRVHLPFRTAVEGDYTLDKRGKIFRFAADVIGNGCAVFAIMLTDGTAFLPQAESDNARITDHDALQAKQIVKIQRDAPRLANRSGAPKSIQSYRDEMKPLQFGLA